MGSPATWTHSRAADNPTVMTSATRHLSAGDRVGSPLSLRHRDRAHAGPGHPFPGAAARHRMAAVLRGWGAFGSTLRGCLARCARRETWIWSNPTTSAVGERRVTGLL